LKRTKVRKLFLRLYLLAWFYIAERTYLISRQNAPNVTWRSVFSTSFSFHSIAHVMKQLKPFYHDRSVKSIFKEAGLFLLRLSWGRDVKLVCHATGGDV